MSLTKVDTQLLLDNTQGFSVNASVILASYVIPTNNNAHSTGPITINSGVSITVPTGSRWVIL